MKMILVILYLLIITTLSKIPKIIWSYIEEDDGLTTIQRICLRNNMKIAKQSGYQLKIINKFNYLQHISNMQQLNNYLKKSPISKKITFNNLLQIFILNQHGGIWINNNILLIQKMLWLDNLHNQQSVNNKIINPQNILFYQPRLFFQKTKQKNIPQKQNIIITPKYQTSFIACTAGSVFIKNWKNLYVKSIAISYPQFIKNSKQNSLQTFDYYQDPDNFLKWTLQQTVVQKQIQNDKQNQRLAVQQWSIIGIDMSKTGQIIDNHANYFEQLASKYWSEVQMRLLNLKPKFILSISQQLSSQLSQSIDVDYMNLQHFHGQVDFYCDDDEVPLRYVVQNSFSHKYLQDQFKVYKSYYIDHHCQSSYTQVYTHLFTHFIFPITYLILSLYIIRKAVLVIRPQCGERRKRYSQNIR